MCVLVWVGTMLQQHAYEDAYEGHPGRVGTNPYHMGPWDQTQAGMLDN